LTARAAPAAAAMANAMTSAERRVIVDSGP
jgi:hypothetical protein